MNFYLRSPLIVYNKKGIIIIIIIIIIFTIEIYYNLNEFYYFI